MSTGKKIVVVGAGGNIGSHLTPHLGRMPGIGRVTLIDGDIYESKNVLSQDIAPGDVDKPKALVQARRLRRLNRRIEVIAVPEMVENVPLWILRGDVILACLDSRRSRQVLNQAAWRLGAPYIDAGVEASGLLARVNAYHPAADHPCLECAWDERDYELLEQSYPCFGGRQKPAPTNAPSSLGALAASLQAIECQKLLTGQLDQAAVDRQVLVDALHHKHYVTTYRRNPDCRFSHQVWTIKPLRRRPEDVTLGQALQLGASQRREADRRSLRVEGKLFVKRLGCTACGHTRSLLRLQPSLRPAELRCRRCGGLMAVSGLDLMERLKAIDLPNRALSGSLGSLGLRPGDVISIGGCLSETHYVIFPDHG